MAQVAPFRFEPRDCLARRFHPLAKLASLLVLSIASTAAREAWLAPLAAAAFSALGAAGAFSDGIMPELRRLGREGRFIAILGLFVVLFRVVDPWGNELLRVSELLPSCIYLVRLALVFVFAEAYYRSTSPEELAAAATGLARRVMRREDIDPGLYLSLALGFIPACFAAYARCREAALARGYGGRTGRRPRFLSSLALLESFIALSIRSALSTSEALEARGYSPARAYPDRALRRPDLALVAASVAIACCSALI